MYRIVNITDREGNVKWDFINDLESVHPNLCGEIMCPELIQTGGHFYFVWEDNSCKILRTSAVEAYENNGDTAKVVTKNSVYYLEKENI